MERSPPPPPRSLCAGALSFVLVLSFARGAGAQGGVGEAIDFSWDAPAYCPSSARVLARAGEELGDLAARPLPRVRARGEVRPAEGEGRWRLSLRTEGPRGDGERALEADSCEQLADAAALVLALLVRSEFERTSAPEPKRSPAPAPPAGPRLRAALRLGALVDAGSLPALAPGVGAAVAIARGTLGAEATGAAFFPRREQEGPRSGTGGDIGLAAGGLRACYRPFRPFAGGWDAGGCAGAEVGYVWGEGFGLANAKQGAGLWSGALAGAWVSAPLGGVPFALRLGAEGGRTLRAPYFDIEGYGRVFEPSPWFGRLGLGLEWRTP
ncbi:MAG TPA: hypothetical protein VFS43_19665 [Polyangiaceae bacterium]|nr:hypothetical protein [Polyangiaceae bacterium]